MLAATGYPDPVLKLRELLNTYLDPEKVAVILRAFEVGDDAHRGQTRKTGEPYILHPVAVAQMLANMRMDYESIAAAILHDTIEDTPLLKEDIEQQFGQEIADLVDGVLPDSAILLSPDSCLQELCGAPRPRVDGQVEHGVVDAGR